MASAVTALLLAGCAPATTDSAPARDGSAAASPSAGASPELSAGDRQACAGSVALFQHLAADTARWAPERHPFDPTVNAHLRVFALDLASQAQFAETVQLKVLVRDNAAAFDGLARAMTVRRKALVERRIHGTRVAYRALKQACSLG